MVGNLVVDIEIFIFCLFVCLLVCLYLTFCQFRKRKMVHENGGGSLGTPKSDYVICARPLSLVLYWLHIMFSASYCLDQFQSELNPQGHGTLHKQIQSQKGNWAYWYKLLQRYKYRAIRAIFSIIDFLLFSIVSVPFNFH